VQAWGIQLARELELHAAEDPAQAHGLAVLGAAAFNAKKPVCGQEHKLEALDVGLVDEPRLCVDVSALREHLDAENEAVVVTKGHEEGEENAQDAVQFSATACCRRLGVDLTKHVKKTVPHTRRQQRRRG
jgi:hypothetical protein